MLKIRSQEEEIMDDLAIDGEVIDQTLRELNTINQLLGGNQISLELFKKHARGKKEISLADLGCGGGDIMVSMAKWCRKQGIKASFVGIDANPHIVAYAQKHTAEYPEIQYKCLNIFDTAFQAMQFDLIHCCLFTHHFTSEQLASLFRSFHQQAKVGVIINDLHRHFLAYHSIKLLTKIFSRSYMVQNDAAVSVARGFKKAELVQILTDAGVEKYHLKWKWAFRWQLFF
jgi:2-polyprenyl-3-methyl-5-hydroxy-6-metoxy-1,4-benzoquinol methylase